MHDDFSQPNILPGLFHPNRWQLRQWGTLANRRGEVHAAKLLRQVEAARVNRDSSGDWPSLNYDWLLSYRNEIRKVIDGRESESILRYLAKCPRAMVPFGVWLLAKCSDRFRTNHLADFCRHPSPAVRKHVAHALWRLEAWHRLASMAKEWPEDEAVQRFAAKAVASIESRPFDERFNRYARHVNQSHAPDAAAASRMPYWALNPSWSRTPPKSVEFIRRMLQRIHRWVHGMAE
jgi:hypothetical protein